LNLSKALQIKPGLPQRSVLAPTLFNICRHMYHHQITIWWPMGRSAYDTTIITQNKILKLVIKALWNSLDKLSLWFSRWKLGKWNSNSDSAKYLEIYLNENYSEIFTSKNLTKYTVRMKILCDTELYQLIGLEPTKVWHTNIFGLQEV